MDLVVSNAEGLRAGAAKSLAALMLALRSFLGYAGGIGERPARIAGPASRASLPGVTARHGTVRRHA